MRKSIPRIDLPCPSLRRLRLSVHKYLAWCRQFFVLRRQKVSQRANTQFLNESRVYGIGLTSWVNTDFSWKVVGYRMHGTRSRVAFRAPSPLVFSMWKLPRQLLVFWGVSILYWLKTFYCVVTLLVTIETNEMTQVLTSRIDYVRGISLLVF